jgi:hypothetical protein
MANQCRPRGGKRGRAGGALRFVLPLRWRAGGGGTPQPAGPPSPARADGRFAAIGTLPGAGPGRRPAPVNGAGQPIPHAATGLSTARGCPPTRSSTRVTAGVKPLERPACQSAARTPLGLPAVACSGLAHPRTPSAPWRVHPCAHACTKAGRRRPPSLHHLLERRHRGVHHVRKAHVVNQLGVGRGKQDGGGGRGRAWLGLGGGAPPPWFV